MRQPGWRVETIQTDPGGLTFGKRRDGNTHTLQPHFEVSIYAQFAVNMFDANSTLCFSLQESFSFYVEQLKEKAAKAKMTEEK